MIKVEIKAEIQKNKTIILKEYLKCHGFTAVGTNIQEDVYYEHPSKSFDDTDEALRVRRSVVPEGEAEILLTYKGCNRSEVGQTRKELECTVSNADILNSILLELGFSPSTSVKKVRSSFSRDDIIVSIDEVEELGSFIELEIMCAEGYENDCEKRVDELLNDLRFAYPVINNSTYLELIRGKAKASE